MNFSVNNGNTYMIDEHGKSFLIVEATLEIKNLQSIKKTGNNQTYSSCQIIITANLASNSKITNRIDIKPTPSLVTYFESNDFYNLLLENGCVFPATQVTKRKRAIRAYLQTLLLTITPTETMLLSSGITKYDNHIFSVMGTLCQQPENDFPKINCITASNFRLYSEIDSKNEQLRSYIQPNILNCLKMFMDLDSTTCPLLIMYSVFSVLQDYLPLMGIDHRFILYIVGTTATFKSSLIKLVTDISPDLNSLNLSSSLSSLEHTLNNIGNIPVLIDDFNKTSSGKQRSQKTQIVSEIIQNYPDRHAISKMSGNKMVSLYFKSGLIISAEEVLSNPSTMNRCLIVNHENDIDSKALENLQNCNKTTHFFSYFVQEINSYFLNNYDTLAQNASIDLNKFRHDDTLLSHCSEKFGNVNRIMDTYALSRFSIHLFKNYLETKQLDPNIINDIYDRLVKACKTACIDMLDSYAPSENSMEHICSLYKLLDYQEIKYASSFKKYYLKRKKYNAVLIEDESILYIRGKTLIFLFREHCNFDTTIRAFTKELGDTYGLLLSDGKGTGNAKWSIHPHNCENRERFYGIHIYDLINLYKDFCKKKDDELYDLYKAMYESESNDTI